MPLRTRQAESLSHPGEPEPAGLRHTVCDIGDELWRYARTKLGPRYNFFHKLAAITIYLIFPSWDDLLLTLAFAKPPLIPP